VATTKAFNPVEVLVELHWEEDGDLEFKSARGGLPKSLWETYSAMANTHGGIILLGVEDSGEVSGVTDVSRLKKSFWDTINNKGKVNQNLLTDSDVSEAFHSGQTILAIRVPQADRHQRPIFLNQNPLHSTYRRNYEGDYRCSEQEVRSMFSDQSEEPVDSQILADFTIEDLDLPSLHQYRQRVASQKPNHPWLSENDLSFLIKLGGWRRDRKSGREGLTVAGLLMFGRDQSIQEEFPDYHVDYREKASSDPAVRWSDRLVADGTWNANLFQFYLRVIQRLSADLKLPFQLDADLFRKGETEVHVAIREALVNSLIHADYRGKGGIVIEKCPDHFSLSNPGTLLISLEQMLHGNISECRNKSLQKMFMMFGAAEKAGSGVDKIIHGWASQHWRAPIISEKMQPSRVDLQLPMVSMIPEKSLNRLQEYFGEEFETFTQLEIQALVTADIEKSVNNYRLRQITDVHSADITSILQGLVAKGALIQEGQARWSSYRLPYERSDSGSSGLYSIHKQDHPVHKQGYSIHKRKLMDEELTDWELDELNEIAAKAQKCKRLPPDEMERIILELCDGRWMTRKLLGELMARNDEGLRARFLTSLVSHKLLRMRYPESTNRVDQAYMSVKQKAK